MESFMTFKFKIYKAFRTALAHGKHTMDVNKCVFTYCSLICPVMPLLFMKNTLSYFYPFLLLLAYIL